LDEIQTKVLRVFLYSQSPHLYYSFGLRLIFLQTHATSVTFWSSITALYNIKEKGGQPDRKSYPLPYVLRNPYINLKIMLRNLNQTACS
jgi:hypothetical protein